MINSVSGFSISNPEKYRSFQEVTGTFNVPEISFVSATTSSVVVALDNYDSSISYSVSSSAGTAARVDDEITVTGLSENQSITVTAVTTGSAGVSFTTESSAYPSLPSTPTLSRTGGTTTTAVISITNYDAGLSYSIGSNAGSATRTDGTITVTGLTAGQAVTVTAIASNTSGNSSQGSITTASVPATPTISFSSSTETTATFTITNYNAAYSYSVSSSSGSASRSGNTITVTGLVAGASVTAYATATVNGVSSAQGSASGTTQLPGSFEQIATVNTDGSASQIIFSSIPQNYKHLVIRGEINSNSLYTTLYMRINSDSTYKYSWGQLISNSYSFAANNNLLAPFSSSLPTAGYQDALVPINLFIQDYSSTSKTKSMLSDSGGQGPYDFTVNTVLSYNSTSAISTISIYLSDNSSIPSGRKISLYGVK